MLKLKKNSGYNNEIMILTVSRKMTKILTVNRKSHRPIETLLKWMIILYHDRNKAASTEYLKNFDTNFSC